MLETLTYPQRTALFSALGAPTAAKLDFLFAGRHGTPVGVNRQHCRPLHPHGKALIDDGLMTLSRNGTKSSRHSALTITDDGLKELARLTKKAEKVLKRHGVPQHEDPHTGSRFAMRTPAHAQAAKTRAIAFSKGYSHA